MSPQLEPISAIMSKNPSTVTFSPNNYLKPPVRVPQYRSNRLITTKLLSAVREDEHEHELELTASGFSSPTSGTFTDFGGFVGGTEKPVCFHCEKLIDLFCRRNKSITFISIGIRSRVDHLIRCQTSNWSPDDVDFLVNLYKNGA